MRMLTFSGGQTGLSKSRFIRRLAGKIALLPKTILIEIWTAAYLAATADGGRREQESDGGRYRITAVRKLRP